MFLPLLMPLLAFAGFGEILTRSIFGFGAVIAFYKKGVFIPSDP